MGSSVYMQDHISLLIIASRWLILSEWFRMVVTPHLHAMNLLLKWFTSIICWRIPCRFAIMLCTLWAIASSWIKSSILFLGDLRLTAHFCLTSMQYLMVTEIRAFYSHAVTIFHVIVYLWRLNIFISECYYLHYQETNLIRSILYFLHMCSCARSDSIHQNVLK